MTPALVLDVGRYARETVRRGIETQPATFCGSALFMLLTGPDHGPIGVGQVPVLDPENHIPELRAYAAQEHAEGIIVVRDAMYRAPGLGPTAAVLLIAMHRSGVGLAEAASYRVLPSLAPAPPAIEWGIVIDEHDRLDAYRQVFL